jgi:hypothetical protein
MIVSPQKIQDIARDLESNLNQRFKNKASGLNSIRTAFDSNGAPQLFVSNGGNEAEGQPVALIYLQQISAVSNDIFGNPALAYCPSTSMIAYELNAAGAPIPNQQDLDTLKWELWLFGMQYNQVQIANGLAVTAVNALAAIPALSLDSLYWPTKGV